ncbi:DNA cytosine methyltransferase [Nonomuraea sp. NPDC003560]|uniref:DNA cytosine methyltransferase n=1 Tax=Nonomuraea sp. NPDC003560 TaxID=3364341 RepID=UPI00367B4F90
MADLTVDLFAGPGGWSEAMRQLRLREVGLEWDTAACLTRRAAGHATIQCDVAAYPTEPFKDLIAGLGSSSPCQPWSRAGKGLARKDQPLVHEAVQELSRGHDTRAKLLGACRDKRSLLAAEPVRWLYDLRPAWTVMEQVPDVLPLFQHIADILRGWGYSVWVGILNAANYGVAQTRRRAILLASRTHEVAAPLPTHTEHDHGVDLLGERRLGWVSMADALDLPAGMRINTRGDRKTSGGNEFSCDGPSWALTEKARSWWVLRHSKRANATERRLDQPAATLVAGHARHDFQWVRVDGRTDLEKRPLLLSEAAVLQGFPADYPFQGSESKKFLQIANAVPPPLGVHVLAAASGAGLPVSAEVAA